MMSGPARAIAISCLLHSRLDELDAQRAVECAARSASQAIEMKLSRSFGAADSSSKSSAPVMWEQLLMRRPNRYDLPSEQEIRQEIGRLFSLQKSGKDLRGEVSGKRGRKGMDDKREKIIINFLREDPGLKPKEGRRMLLQQIENRGFEDIPAEKQVKSKISSLKQAAKKEREAGNRGLRKCDFSISCWLLAIGFYLLDLLSHCRRRSLAAVINAAYAQRGKDCREARDFACHFDRANDC